MPVKISNSENVQTLLKLTDDYNRASEKDLEGLLIDIQDVIEVMTVEERYAYNIRLLASKRNIVPEIIDLEIELQLIEHDIEPDLEAKLAFAANISPPSPN